MKNFFVILIIIFLVRIDFWLGLLEKTKNKLVLSVKDRDVELSKIQPKMISVSLNQDAFLKSNPKQKFFLLLKDFHASPTENNRLVVVEFLKGNPDIFEEKLDVEFEIHLFDWRDLLAENMEEVILFVLDSNRYLKGENKMMTNRFISLGMDLNMEKFISVYKEGTDINCNIVLLTGDPLNEEQKLNLFLQRKQALSDYLKKESLNHKERTLATICSTRIDSEILKRKIPVQPEKGSSEEASSVPLSEEGAVE